MYQTKLYIPKYRVKRGAKKKLNAELFNKLYYEENKSLAEIGRLFEVSRVAIYKIAKELGIKRRSKSEARILAQKIGKVPHPHKEINENFFSSWSPEMAYILGLLITDGCISKSKNSSYRISLCLNDKDLLCEVVKTIGSAHNITESKHQKGLNTFIFGREKIAQDLIKLGMKPRKSLDIEFPYAPKEYLHDFIRGVFDGDGSVFYDNKCKIKKLRTSFTSGSKNFIYKLEQELQGLGMSKRNLYKTYRKNISYSFKYGHDESIKLFNIMYVDLENDLFLKRKYDKFVNAM